MGDGNLLDFILIDMLDHYCSQFVEVDRAMAVKALREHPQRARPIVERNIAELQARLADLTALLLEA